MTIWDLQDEVIFRELRITLGRHPQTGQPALLFMVQRGFGEYPARLALSEEEFEQYRQDPAQTLTLTDRYQGLDCAEVRALGAEC